jgi:hypothetical protein
VDNDGMTDFLFHLLLVGDAVLQRDRIQFYVSSGINRNLLNDAQDQSAVLNKMDVISKNMAGFTWWEISAIVLAEKIITYTESHWEGGWKMPTINFFPFNYKSKINSITARWNFLSTPLKKKCSNIEWPSAWKRIKR